MSNNSIILNSRNRIIIFMVERIGELNKPDIDAQILKLVRDLSDHEIYPRKHAAWTLARLAQKGKAGIIVQTGAVPKLIKCLSDDELIIKYRAVWTLSMLAKHGQKQAILDANVIPIIQKLIDDNSQVEIANIHSGEIIFTTLGELAREALENLK